MTREGVYAIAGLVGLCGLVIGAAVHHIDKDRRMAVELIEARYRIKQQEALLALADRKGGSTEVLLARVPRSDFDYDLVMLPRLAVR